MADAMIGEELTKLVTQDNSKYPVKGMKSVKAPSLEEFSV